MQRLRKRLLRGKRFAALARSKSFGGFTLRALAPVTTGLYLDATGSEKHVIISSLAVVSKTSKSANT